MKYVSVPVAGGEIRIDVRQHEVDLVLAVEDGDRTIRIQLRGELADQMVWYVASTVDTMTVEAVSELSRWSEPAR